MENLTLKDCMPLLVSSDETIDKSYIYKDMKVIKEYYRSEKGFKEWIGTHKNVHYWCILENNIAVAMNENPGRGISFPMKSLKNYHL